MSSLRRLLTGPDPPSLAAVARARRFRMFLERFPQLSEMRILDVGGAPVTWLHADVRPRHVTLLNLPGKIPRQQEAIRAVGADGWMAILGGDACDPPEEVTRERYDLVYSNSVIEHVGGHLRRRHLAYWIQTLGAHHWVQTPNRYFPLEPHWLMPGLQLAAPTVQAAVLRRWPLNAYGRSPHRHERVQEAMGIELLSPGALRSYFPASELLRERALGMTKSLIATR